MAFKGTAGKSSTGASMSKYDVEVEARLKALEAKVADLESHSHEAPCDTGTDNEKLNRLIATLNNNTVFTGSCPRNADGVREFV